MLNGKFIVKKSYCSGVEDGDILNFVNGYSKEWFENGKLSDQRKVHSIEDFHGRYSTRIALYNPKSLITVGRVVELRNGMMAIVMQEYLSGAQLFLNLNAYNDDLTCRIRRTSKEFDIVSIYDAPFCGENTWRLSKPANKVGLASVWKREEKSKEQVEKEEIQAEMEKLAERLRKLEVK